MEEKSGLTLPPKEKDHMVTPEDHTEATHPAFLRRKLPHLNPRKNIKKRSHSPISLRLLPICKQLSRSLHLKDA